MSAKDVIVEILKNNDLPIDKGDNWDLVTIDVNDVAQEIIDSPPPTGEVIPKNKMNELLLDQLERFEGVLGKYNCQHGGLNCNFQTNCHRLLNAEINKLRVELGMGSR